ncbi:B12-binding domain-containing radical SAM protein [Acidobacteria bacterium AH-259-L09]|nr:B12-binding domain-containing radical SAM protein [Acidobacteria bacterium AH-259-L09]
MAEICVLFIYPNQRAESMVPPSIAIFSRLLKDRGFAVDLFDTSNYDIDADYYTNAANADKERVLNLEFRPFESRAEANKKHRNAVEDLVRKVEVFQPDLIAVTATESTFLLAVQLLKAVRHYKIPTLLGGVLVTFAPERAISFPEIDMICVGEGEHAIVDLCELMRAGKDYSKVTNLWIKKKDGTIIRNSIRKPVNVDETPLLDIGIFEEGRLYRPMAGKIYRMLPVETHRGCPYTCTFCNSPSQNTLYAKETNSNFFRKRSMEKVYEELLYYRDVLEAEYIYFWADTFFAYSATEFDAFCEMYSDIKLPFWCQTRPETVTHYRIKRLKEVGMHRISFGIEHGNEKFRREVVDRRYSNQLAIDALQIPPQYGVPFSANNIIGFPDETLELAMDTVELNRQFNADTMSCSILQPYYGTPLRPICVKKGYLNPDAICPANSDDTLLKMPGFRREEMKGLRRTFAMYVKFPKDRWPEIRLAEQLTPEGDAIWNKLREEFSATYFASPDTEIELSS